MATELSMVDKDLALEQAGGNADLARELYQMLQNELPAYRLKIRSLYETQDIPALTEAVHKLHGSATYCGVPALKSAAERFESSLKRGEEANYKEGLNAVLHAIDELMQHPTPPM